MIARFKNLSPAHAIIAIGMICLFAAIAMFRPLMPVDETRYLSVAWEMMLQNHWILPSLNFEPYSHKPPMLFWLIHALWEVFGVGVWPARIVSVVSMIGLFLMTQNFGRAVSGNNQQGIHAMLLLAALPGFLIYGSMIMFDTLLGVWVVAAMLMLWKLAHGAAFKCWFAFGVLLGLGILTKGPVALVYMVPPALLVRLWTPHTPTGWYNGICLAVLTGAMIGLAWAIPAAIDGGHAYAEKIFVTQSAGRMVNAFDHREPVWFYIPVLIGFIVPLFFLPALWRGLKDTLRAPEQRQVVRFILCWIIPAFLFFSAINSKQIHYMVPILPGFAVLAALALNGRKNKGLIIMVIAAFVLVIAAHIAGGKTLLPKYDLSPLAVAMAPFQDRPMAAAPKYDGEYGYVLRAQKHITSIGREDTDIDRWFGSHPDGVIIVRYKTLKHLDRYTVLFTLPFRNREWISIIEMKPQAPDVPAPESQAAAP